MPHSTSSTKLQYAPWAQPGLCVRLILATGFFFLVAFPQNAATAQLPQDVRDVFEGMLDSLDDDLKKKFEEAIKKDTDRVEFSADQFIRFRKNPANPFEGLDQIDVKPGGTNVALKFELPSMRRRRKAPLERQNSNLLDQLRAPLKSVAPSTVKVLSKGRHVAMGAVVSANGLIITKASEVELRKQLSCEFADGSSNSATLVKKDSVNDIAILKVERSGLSPIRWSFQKPKLGDFLLTPNQDGSVFGLGCYSVAPRSTQTGERAFLGVKPISSPTGVSVFDIQPGTASHDAGLRDGDVILKLNKDSITNVTELVQAIKNRRPGDKVTIEYLRDGQKKECIATLAGNKISGERAARFKMMNRLGAVPSRRSDNFISVFQHDTPLFPENCGGPIVDLEGNVVGINIARKGRAASYALPSALVATVVEQLLKETIADASASK